MKKLDTLASDVFRQTWALHSFLEVPSYHFFFSFFPHLNHRNHHIYFSLDDTLAVYVKVHWALINFEVSVD